MMGLGRLFWKLFLGFWLTLVAAGIMVGTGVWLHQQQRMPRIEPALAAGPRAELLLQSAAATLRFGGEPALRALIEDEGSHAHGTLRLYAVDERGEELLGRSVPAAALRQARDRAAAAGLPDSEEQAGAIESEGADSPADKPSSGALARRGVRAVESAEGRSFLLFVAPVNARSAAAAEGMQTAANATLVGPAQARPRGRASPGMRRMLFDPLVGVAIGLLASLGFSALLAWYLTRPIRHLSRAFAAVADGRLETRVASLMGRRTDEIAALGHDFDRMAEQLQSLILAQRRLLHDVSHELRSPLARLHAAIGLARQSPARSAAMLERIEHEAQRIDELVGELLALARLEAAAAGGGNEPVDIVGLLEEVVRDARFEARAKGRDVDEAFAPDLGQPLIEGRRDWLQRAFENVIRNALRHTAAGTTVEVRLRRALEGGVEIGILDSGPGVPDDELESIFEPFNRGRQPPEDTGHGLGLAIARRAIAAHGGSIVASNRKTGGLVITIVLPVAAASPGSAVRAQQDAHSGRESHAMTPRSARSLARKPRDL